MQGLAVVAAVLGSLMVLAQCQTPCCFPTKFNVSLTDLATINSDTIMVSTLEVDFAAEKQRASTYTLDTQSGTSTFLATEVLDFSKGKMYVVEERNPSLCTEKFVSLKPQQCVPAGAQYMGGTYLGPRLGGLQYDGWRYKIPGSDSVFTTAFTKLGCVPLVQGITSSEIQNGLFFFTTFGEGLASPIDIPEACKHI
ncbi:uncharacterized protein [Littorina saxatilis]|uniref:Uncharacterized protein n=1 Tax=Littorina saxatilis TaxID=31220 RepID=A0AAN9GCZ1_9CAEN